MPSLNELAAAVGLKHLLSKSYFDITHFNKIAELRGMHVMQDERYKTLAVLHCVAYSSMTPELRKMLRETVTEMLAMADFIDVEAMEVEPNIPQPAPEKRSWFKLGSKE